METTAKRYYAKVKGSRFISETGKEIQFNAHGFVDITDSVIQKELDAILGNNPMIFTQDKLATPLPRIQQNAASEAEVAASEQALKGQRVREAQEVGPIPANADKPSDVNASTADPQLKSAFQQAQEAAASRLVGAAPSISG